MKTEIQERIERIVTNGLGYSETHGNAYPDSALHLQMKLCKMEGEKWLKPTEFHHLLESLGFKWQRFCVLERKQMQPYVCGMKRKGYEVEISPAFSMGLKPEYIPGMISVYIRKN